MSGIGTARVGQLCGGVSADTVRRRWPEWARTLGFPHPLFTGGLLRWDEAAIVAWKARRSGAGAADAAELQPDWAAIARQRGLALDAGRDPDL